MFKKIILLIILTTSLFSCKPETYIATLNDHKIEPEKIDTFIQHKMDSLNIPGMSLAVINDAEIVYYRTFGVVSTNTNDPVVNTTLFDAGSISKTMFAYLVLKMVDKDVLDLDTPLYKYLPYPDIEYDERYKLITARMILSHRSGFPNWRFLNKDKKLDIKFTPGTDFLYSGEGFEYLANVIAHLNNIKKDELQGLMENHVFKPLEINHTYYTWNDYIEQNQAKGHVDGKVARGYGIHSDKPGFYASYSLQTDALNYSRFLIALMEGKGLSKTTHKQMLETQSLSPENNDTQKWGLGIGIETLGKNTIYKHGGYNLNFSSGYFFSKKPKNGFVFFTNSNTGYALNRIFLEFFNK